MVQLSLTAHGDLPVSRKVHDRLLAESKAAAPNECCGLLLGRYGRISVVRAAPNVHATPATHFEIDPQTLVDAHRAARSGGLQVMGYYHSHPTTEAVPSAHDRNDSAKDGKIWAIIGRGESVRFWQDDPDGFHALSYEVLGRSTRLNTFWRDETSGFTPLSYLAQKA